MKEWVIIQEAKEEGREEGRLEGRAEGKEEIIFHMLQQNKTVEEVAKLCGIPLENVKRVKQKMLTNA